MDLINKKVPTRKMPKNASKTTARKAYYTALASERNAKRPLMDRLTGGKRISAELTRKAERGTVGSMKVAGMKARKKRTGV